MTENDIGAGMQKILGFLLSVVADKFKAVQ